MQDIYVLRALAYREQQRYTEALHDLGYVVRGELP